jgi:hypothetical protein
MATVPRAELATIATRYGVDYSLASDPTVIWVRGIATWLRRDLTPGERFADQLLAEADELDALADRYEGT